MTFPATRLRRLRQTSQLRALVRETHLSPDDLILPLFIRHGQDQKLPIKTMPGQFQFSLDQLKPELEDIQAHGLKSVLLFGIPETKDATGTSGITQDGLIPRAIQTIKELAPELLVITDNCFCDYTDHGHCGVLKDTAQGKQVDNDETLKNLADMCVNYAKAGADMVAPSGMMDGMIAAIRAGLDHAGYQDTPIMSYSSKFASAFYGPFRDAVDCAPHFGDRKSYQLDPANAKEACRESELDVLEGADILMVKPALAYLDVIYQVKQAHPTLPLAAYSVSGEYAMIKAAADLGYLDEQAIAMESLLSLKRAGADILITYFAKDVARWLG